MQARPRSPARLCALLERFVDMKTPILILMLLLFGCAEREECGADCGDDIQCILNACMHPPSSATSAPQTSVATQAICGASCGDDLVCITDECGGGSGPGGTPTGGGSPSRCTRYSTNAGPWSCQQLGAQAYWTRSYSSCCRESGSCFALQQEALWPGECSTTSPPAGPPPP